MDKEFFECDEYEESKEIQYFSAEKYRVSENAKSAEETFDAPETYVSGNTSAKPDDKGMSLGDAEELAQSASAHASASATASVSMTAGTSASAGATGVFASIAAVCVAVTAGIVPVAGITQDYPEEPPIYQEEEPAGEPTEVGSLSFLNYRVEYYRNEDSDEIFSDITFYFEGTLNDGYTCELSDASTGVAVGIEDNTAVFVNVDRGDRDFYLTIYDDNDEVVETRTVNVEDNYIYDNSLDVDYAYKVTYNPDNTGNLYAYLIPGREGDFVTYINIFTSSEDGAYETVSDGLLSAVFNISEEKYWVNFVSYYVKDNNYYSYFSSEEICISNSSFDWSASVTDDKLTLNFGNELNGLVEVRVTYEDSAYEDLSFTADESGGNTYELTLSRISRNPTVEVFASAVLYDHDPSGYITGTVGLNYREVYGYAEVSAFVSSAVTLSRCEIFNSGYNIVSDDETYAPVRLYFDGFLNDGDTYSVTVINADGEEIKSVTGLTLSDEPVIFTDLEVEATYTFSYAVTAGGEEKPSDSITRTLLVPEYTDLPSYFCLTPNPGDVLVTYNEDGTSDVYLYMGVQETKYDMYYRVYLVDAYGDGSVFLEYTGKEDVAIFRNIPAGIYSVMVGVLLNDDGTCYSVYDLQWPSGTIVTGLDENGYYPEYCGSASYDSSTGELYIGVSGKVVGDLRITVIPDGGEPTEITVAAVDITVGFGSSECTIGLNDAELTTFTTVIEGDAVFQYGEGDKIKNAVTVTGNESCPFRIETIHGLE